MDGRDSSNPLDSLNKVDGLWYDDADVVFCAGKSKFRVYRGILSAQSKKFRDMLALPQGEGVGKGALEDTPQTRSSSVTVINLPDKGSDVYRFFKAIFDPSFYLPPPSMYTLNVTVSILRLALKYSVPFLVQRAVSHLDFSFPLERNNILECVIQIPNDGQDEFVFKVLECYLDIIPLAFIADAKWIVPSLLYLINLTYGVRYIMSHPSFGLLPDPQYQILIVQSCLNNELDESHRNSWVGMLPSENCVDEGGCAYVSRTVQAQVHKKSVSSRPSRWTPDAKLSNGKMFCRNCQNAGKKYWDEFKDKYWNRYPVLCGFKSWEEVKRARSKAVEGCGR